MTDSLLHAPAPTAPVHPEVDGPLPVDEWFWVEGVDALPPFLTSVVSDDDHWLFVASNGGLSAGRGTPDLALFAYVTQDRLIDLAGTTGPLTRVRVDRGEEGVALWRPLDPNQHSGRRRLGKKLDGAQLCFEERSPELGLRMSYTWGFSRRFGFVRRAVLANLSDAAVTVELLDGLQNLQACGLGDAFVNQYGNLVDAYKRVECVPDSHLRLVYLSSIPTDRAEPSESLRCNVAWMAGLQSLASLVSTQQVERFEQGLPVVSEPEARGQRAACLDRASLRLAPGQQHCWYTVADVGLSTARASFLQQFLLDHDDAARSAMLEAELRQTSLGLQRLVASADGLQCSADARRQGRHYSNVMFNIMRGGVFLDNGLVPRDALLSHLRRANPAVAQRHAAWVAGLPERVAPEVLLAEAGQQGDDHLERLTREYLPLTFSRRHGDPSRPWNRFAIQVRDAHGRPALGYQGNWRDIFQNWEALVYAFPDYVEGTIARFLSASTADGYNPYKITSEGIEWETIDPDQPWSNIGYWGDHQIIYLLRLLEASHRFHPQRLDSLLDRPVFAYARVPYRIAPYGRTLENPRVTITFDDEAQADIDRRVERLGSDGQLLAGPDGEVLQVGLVEKLLVPLLAKLANFVPGAGIWMNTQRPEWNDANNALVGYGVSVVTLASCHRALVFLLEWWGALDPGHAVRLSAEVLTLLRAQAEVYSAGVVDAERDPHARRAVMDRLGESVSLYREGLYTRGLSGQKATVSLAEVISVLDDARAALARSLRANRRPDGLFHSYNLLRFLPDGGVDIARLPEMLEGQVAVLSARLLDPAQALDVARALQRSALYRADQDSYLLYPDRDLPRFLDKNRIAPELVASSDLLAALAADPDQTIVERDAAGALRFGGHLRNADELREALDALPAHWRPLVEQDGPGLAAHLEDIFDHHAFTGRSGTFFAYEGLGSIYWHMVSKLVLALQESALGAAEDPSQVENAAALARAYRAALEGLGMHKSPEHHGAFPTDAYSHTPKHTGAQQPGMTGQVKEDILSRWGELGLSVRDGRLSLRPWLLRADELLAAPHPFRYFDIDGEQRTLEVPAGAMAFTFCQVPILYQLGVSPRLEVELAGGERVAIDGSELPAAWSSELYGRTGRVRGLTLTMPREWLDGAG